MHQVLVPSNRDSSPQMTQLVSFSIAAEEYGVDIMKVREIIRMVEITKVPNAPDYLDGVINLRGTVIQVVSLRRLFGMAEEETSGRTRIMVMDINNTLTGFIVDHVSEVIRLSGAEIQPPPSLATGDGHAGGIAGLVQHHDRLLILMDVDRLFSGEQQLLCAA
jgi:purine-binding chemotaxis protein CheW